jgi:hypothetical protein
MVHSRKKDTFAGADLQAESNLRSKLMGQGEVSSFGVVLLECGGIFCLVDDDEKDECLAERRL